MVHVFPGLSSSFSVILVPIHSSRIEYCSSSLNFQTTRVAISYFLLYWCHFQFFNVFFAFYNLRSFSLFFFADILSIFVSLFLLVLLHCHSTNVFVYVSSCDFLLIVSFAILNKYTFEYFPRFLCWWIRCCGLPRIYLFFCVFLLILRFCARINFLLFSPCLYTFSLLLFVLILALNGRCFSYSNVFYTNCNWWHSVSKTEDVERVFQFFLENDTIEIW